MKTGEEMISLLSMPENIPDEGIRNEIFP